MERNWERDFVTGFQGEGDSCLGVGMGTRFGNEYHYQSSLELWWLLHRIVG
jgi:hypothetical protein